MTALGAGAGAGCGGVSPAGTSQLPPAVVLGLSPSGLYLVREYACAGIPVYGISDSAESGAYSKYLRRTGRFRHVSSRSSDPDDRRLMNEVEEIGREHGTRPLLFPASDRYIEWISRNYLRLGEAARFTASYEPVRYRRLLDKHEFYRACEATETPYPLRVSVEEDGWEAAAAALDYPVLVKPGRLHEVTDIMGSRKVFICETSTELLRLGRRLPAERGGWLVQEIVRGPDSSIYCLGGVRTRGGEITAALSGRKLRQFPPGYGTASALLLDKAPRVLWRATARLLEELEVEGMFEIEFKRDVRDDRWKVFEVNARTALWFEAARKAGVPLAMAAYRELLPEDLGAEVPQTLTGEPEAGAIPVGPHPGRLSVPDPPRIVWKSSVKDLVGRLLAWSSRITGRGTAGRQSAGGSAGGYILARSSWALFEYTDPLPAALEMAGYLRKGSLRVLRRMSRWLFIVMRGKRGGSSGEHPGGRR